MEDKLYQHHFGALNSIKSSGGWMKFFGVLMYILASVIFLIAVIALFGSAAFDAVIKKSSSLSGFSMRYAIYIGVLLYLILAFLIGLLGYWLHRSGSAAANIGPMQVENNLEQYASNFRKYVAFTFVISLLMMIGSILVIIIS